MKKWIKFSTDIHRDRKIWKLSKDAQLVFFHLLSIAGNEDKGGELPPFEDIQLELWFLKYSEKALKSTINELVKSEIVSVEENGKFRLTNFEKWQISDKTKSEINHDYYLKSKNKKSEIQTNSDLIQTEKNLNSDLIQTESQTELRKDSVEIQTLEIDIDKEIEIDKELEKENKKKKEKEKVGVANATSAHTSKKARGELKPFGIAENVMLTEEEYQSLCEKLGKESADEQIEALSLYMGRSASNAKKYTNHYLTILSWARQSGNYQKSSHPLKEERKSWREIAEEIAAEQDVGSDSGDVIEGNFFDSGEVVI